MYLALVLHIYQPPTQYPEMLRKITKQSYERIMALLEEFPKAKITLNIPGSLSGELLEIGREDLIGRIRGLVQRGQVELTACAAYHPILPYLPKREIIRQIQVNDSINRSLFGDSFKPQGFFPPELAYDTAVGEVLEELGFTWVLVDGSAVSDWQKFLSFIYRRKGGKLLAIPREETLSFRIAFGRIRTVVGLVRAISLRELEKDQYLVLAMDGETFGHHQPKQLRFLEELLRAGEAGRFRFVTVSDLIGHFPRQRETELEASTWGYTEVVDGQRVWVRWKNPGNPLHNLIGHLRELSFNSVTNDDAKSRQILDRALCSDTLWWASGRPYKHPGMVERGARMFLDAVLSSRSATLKQKQAAEKLYHEISQMGYKIPGRRKRDKG